MRSKLWLPVLLGAFFWIWDFDDGTAYADVRDTAGIFSPDAVQQANKVIDEIHQKYGKDVVVETHAGISANLRSGYDPNQKAQFYQQWQQARAKELKLDGVIVLITRDPGRIEIGAGGDTSKRGFTAADREQATQRMAARFRNQEFDQGLLDGVNYIRQSFFANMGARSGQPNYNVQTPAGGSGGGGVNAPASAPRKPGLSMFWWLIIIGVGLFLLMRFMRRRQQAYSPGYGSLPGQPGNYGPRGDPYHGQQYPGGATGAGGWGRGMLGGLMGGMAGGWLYDKMRGGGGGATGAGGGGAAGYGGPGASDEGQGFSSSGADFGGGGDSGGGGDFGGGDGGSSGADF